MNQTSPLDVVNQKTYAKGKVVDYYDGIEQLFPTEKVLFDRLAPALKVRKSSISVLGEVERLNI
jgi:hypothetical protein